MTEDLAGGVSLLREMGREWGLSVRGLPIVKVDTDLGRILSLTSIVGLIEWTLQNVWPPFGLQIDQESRC
jgi:hypothetical protein